MFFDQRAAIIDVANLPQLETLDEDELRISAGDGRGPGDGLSKVVELHIE
jgi:hypothetical protein